MASPSTTEYKKFEDDDTGKNNQTNNTSPTTAQPIAAFPPPTTTITKSTRESSSDPALANTSNQEEEDEKEFSSFRCSGIYFFSSVWCSVFYVTLLFSCLFLRQTIHVAMIIAAIAKPCVRRV